jgi:DNA (cytosine-5)-methyltransferase 1
MWRASGRSLTGIVKLNHLDLFSGIGGFSLGLERTGGFRTIGFCETDAYCTKVLQKNFPGIPIHGDIKKLKGTDIGTVDIITGGYPCQPFSVAGKQKGVEDPRHLWPEMFRVVKESRPNWVIGENVAGHIKLGLDSVLKDLESEGYRTRTFSISASSIGANHQRERIWIVAHSERNGLIATKKRGSSKETISKQSKRKNNTLDIKGTGSISETNTDVADTCGTGLSSAPSSRSDEESGEESRNEFPAGCGSALDWGDISGNWTVEPNVGRVAHGIPSRVDRIKSLGNSLVPHIPYYIGQSIIATYEDNDTV